MSDEKTGQAKVRECAKLPQAGKAKVDAVVFRLNAYGDEVRVTKGLAVFHTTDEELKPCVDDITNTPLGELLLREYAGLL
jgi:hypothetical protein